MLEQTRQKFKGPLRSFYTSRLVPQGFTQRGQTIGAAIGPGSSSQWIAGDYITGLRRIGLFAGRIRWDDDAYYKQPSAISFFAHDVTIYAGLRGGATLLGSAVNVEVLRSIRLNYLYQTAKNGYEPDPGFDVKGYTVKFSVTPSLFP